VSLTAHLADPAPLCALIFVHFVGQDYPNT